MALKQRGLRDAKAQVMQPDGALALECHVDVGVHGRYSQVRGHLMCAIMSYAYVQQHDMCVFRLYIDSIIIYIFVFRLYIDSIYRQLYIDSYI